MVMTPAEAAEELKSLEFYDRPFDNSMEETNKANRKREALYMAIRLLELISYREFISKKSVHKMINEWVGEDDLSKLHEMIDTLTPINEEHGGIND